MIVLYSERMLRGFVMMQEEQHDSADKNRPTLLSAMTLQINIAHRHVLECAALLERASKAMTKNDQKLAMRDILEAEPLLYEAHILLNAISIARRNSS